MQELDKLDTEFNSIRDYLLEAAEFLRKFSSRNNGGNEAFGDNETKILSMLWVEADKYDELVLSMFESFRQVLGKKSSRSDTSRGVTENDYEEQSIFYFYCNWELTKDNDKLIRNYGIGAQIIKNLKIKKMILVTKSLKKVIGLEGYDMKITKQELI